MVQNQAVQAMEAVYDKKPKPLVALQNRMRALVAEG